MIQNNLGDAITRSCRPVTGRSEPWRCAIACYESALRVHKKTELPADWAVTEYSLGNAYRSLPTGDRGVNLAARSPATSRS